jgi:hypothetical protein
MHVPSASRVEKAFFAADGSRLAEVGVSTIRVSAIPADLIERRTARLRGEEAPDRQPGK